MIMRNGDVQNCRGGACPARGAIARAPALALALALALFSAIACEGYVEEEEGTPEAEACEHAVEGPANAVDASATADDAPDVTTEHTRHDITLVDGAPGFVRFESEGGAHIVFMTADVAIAFTSASGEAIGVDEKRDETTCDEVVVSQHVVLPVGLIDIALGPDEANDAVSLVIERAELEE